MMTIPMDFRCEARFGVKSLAKVTLQGNRESELECILVDISATGIGLITKESLAVEELIVLETEQHFVLAKVRHCGPRGDRFSVGLERIHTVLADASESGKIEQRSALVQAFQSGTPSEIPPAQPAETGPAFRSSEISEALVSSDLQSHEVSKRPEPEHLPATATSDSGLILPELQVPTEPAHSSEPAHEAEKIEAAMLPDQTQQKPIEPGTVDPELIRLQSTSSCGMDRDFGPFFLKFLLPL